MSDLDPTQQGGQVEQPRPTANPRNAALAELAQQAHERSSEDLQGFDEETGKVEEKEAKPAKVQAEAEPEVEQAEEVKLEPAAPKMLTIIVDGTPVEVEESRILEAGKRTLQKDQAADRRLQEATQKMRQADEMFARAQRLSPQDATHQQQPQALSQDAQSQQATNGLDPAALDQYLESKLYRRDAEKAAAKFREDFPLIASDPYLMDIAGNMEQQRLATVAALGEGPGDPFEAYRKHGEAVTKWLAERTGVKPSVDVAEKAERKRAITTVPAVNARATPSTAPKVPTLDETIEQMRQRRAAGGRPAQRLQ